MVWRALLLGHLLAAATPTPAEIPPRTWTGDEGETIEAEFIRVQDRHAILQTEGRVLRVPVRRLSKADQQWIDRYEELNRPRTWRAAGPDQLRGRFLEARRGTARIKQGRDVVKVDFAELTADDKSHIAAVYEHVGKELPKEFSAPARSPVAAAANAPDLSATVQREWTDKKGRKIAAGYLGTRGANVVMWRSDREFVYPIARLSEADQEWIAKQNLGLLASDLRSGWRAATSLVFGPPHPPGPPPPGVTDLLPPPPPPERERSRPLR